MGTVFPRQSDNMKLFAVLALAAVAFAEPEAGANAEADPALLYGTYGYGVPYAGTYGAYGAYSAYRPYAYGGYYYGKRSAEAEPEAEADADAYYGYYGYARPYAYGAYGAGYAYRYGAYPYASAYYGKRSADAEPKAEADPALLYSAYGYGLPYAGAYGAYGGYRTYGAYPYAYGGYSYGKRSAEAEPEAEADPAVLYSTASIASPLTTAYTAGVAPLTTAYTHAVAAPLAYTHAIAPVATTVAKTVVPTVAQYSVPSVYSGIYSGYPLYTKRSADAEADPALLYTAGVAPLTTAYTAGVAPYAVAAPYAHYAVAPVATVAKAPAHGVAATYAGLVHSSHVGVCLNNVGVQVPC